MIKAPHSVVTERLLLRRPDANDAGEIHARYAGDRDATRFMGWPMHRSVADAEAFLSFSDLEWERWPAGPYLVHTRADGALIGSTGLAFETPYRAATGFIVARDVWGQGYATEALGAIVQMAPSLGVRRLYAICHTVHPASARVLEKCGFTREGVLQRHTHFPNLPQEEPSDVFSYARIY